MQKQKLFPGPSLNFIENTVRTHEEVATLIQLGTEAISRALELAPSESALVSVIRNDVSWYYGSGFSKEAVDKNVQKMIRELDRGCWLHLLETSKLKVVMNSVQQRAANKQFSESPEPFTRELAASTFYNLFHRRYETLREGIVDIFCSLDRKYKSHDPFKVGKRIILGHVATGNVGWDCRKTADQIDDLWRYCCLMDGVDPSGFNHDEMPTAKMFDRENKTEFIFDYFRVKFHGNGNVHLWLDQNSVMLERINNLIAEHFGAEAIRDS